MNTAPQQPGPSATSGSHRPVTAAPEVVFGHALQGLFEVGLRGRVTPTLAARLKAVGVDLSRPFDIAYPREVWGRVLALTAAELWPAEPTDRAFFLLGRQMLLGYTETLLGRALVSLVKLLGPRRLLGRMTHNLRSGCNYNETKLEDLGPGRARFWINEPALPPGYVAGLLDAAMEIAGASERGWEVVHRDAKGCTYDLRCED